jgi:hypothetical protein
MSGQLHALPALPPGKELPVPIRQEAGWAPEPVWTTLRKMFKAHNLYNKESNKQIARHNTQRTRIWELTYENEKNYV